MAITLTQLRREVGQDIGECVVGTVDGASGDYIQDDDLIDVDASETEFDHAWIRTYWEDGDGELYDETRRIRITNADTGAVGYSPNTGTVYLTRSLTQVPPVGSGYEIHKLIDPVQLDRLLLNAVQRCTYIYRIEVTPVANQVLYDLAAYEWLTSPAQIVDVTYGSDPTDTDDARHHPLRSWYVYKQADGGLELHIKSQYVSTGDKLYVDCIRPHGDDLSTDDGEAIDERWAKTAALAEIYLYLTYNGPAQDTTRYAAHARRAAAAFTEQSRKRVPRRRASIRLPDEPRY